MSSKYYKELYRSYYFYFKKNTVCACDQCWKFKSMAEQYFPGKKGEVNINWTEIIHK